MKPFKLRAAAFVLAITFCATAGAEDITVMISGGFSAALDKLAPQYQAATGDTVHIIHGPSMGNSPELFLTVYRQASRRMWLSWSATR